MPAPLGRRGFLAASAALTATVVHAKEPASKRVKVGVIGCGSVARKYLPHLAAAPHVELVSTCDIIPERAEDRARQFGIPNHYPHVDAMLAGAKFDLFVNLTDMQEHERLNRLAILAGKHVWSEKPIANTQPAGQELLDLAQKHGVRVWGAPTVVNSPQYKYMAKVLAEGRLGRVAAAHASYGHLGPDWATFFYSGGGGSLPDLGVYQLTYLTGLFGPAKAVVAMVNVVTPQRTITVKKKAGDVVTKHTVSEEDNAMVLLDHGTGTLSHVQCGFNYYMPHAHDHTAQDHRTVTVTGTGGTMCLAGYDWAPKGVDLALGSDGGKFERGAADAQGYVWEQGASVVAECLATGKEPPFTPEHALHVVEVMTAARKSQADGVRVKLGSTFKWPVAG